MNDLPYVSPNPTTGPPRRRRSLSLLVVLAIGLLLTCCAGIATVGFWEHHGVGVARKDAPLSSLPADATDINYHFVPAMPWIYFEFTTSEQGFENWVAGRAHEDLQGPEEGRLRVHGFDYVAKSPRDFEITNGRAYHWKEEDRGGYYWYDHQSQRAYHFGHSR